MPDGEYDITVTIGDSLPTASGTNATVTLEGVAQPRLTTPAARHGDRHLPHRVTDGQLTIGFIGSGLGAAVNGVVVAPVIPATPTGLDGEPGRLGTASTSPGRPPTAPPPTGSSAPSSTDDHPAPIAPVAEDLTGDRLHGRDGRGRRVSYAYRVVG